ncbi:Nif3-like dinuclear metal center hexameric protein [Cohnella sp. AR92]|uniref:Nif3-like dinuclear metal center hexameric protein n=1 Tax=Cohnella sp. AR92 TaxID=648716 RepID=UPI000F8EE2F8|nr:Nif3-like dinuclear metal center hexameric protein [Cohnella sp. AR92]RUS45197.1 NGG1p interacting factor NIF3 [Cohnella sp. AR92]
MKEKAAGTNVGDVLQALNVITRGRMVTDWNGIAAGAYPYVVMKSSNIPGKSVLEIPGLVFGDANQTVKRIGIGMTLTESMIELASGMELDLLIVHHPVADAASSGGVPFLQYLPLYGLSLIELHEAFHGLHPGMTFLHGHRKVKTDIAFGGVPGNVLHQGIAFDEIKTAGDILNRIGEWMGREVDLDLLAAERAIRGESALQEATLANPAKLLAGSPDQPVKHILHFFPHTGFSVANLQTALHMYPETDTLIASISRVREDHEFVRLARERGLVFIAGNPHSVEIVENGLPLAYALEMLLPSAQVFVLRERVTAVPLREIGHARMAEYGREMAGRYLIGEPSRVARIN